MSRRQTQKDKVLEHLKTHGMITPLDALKLYGAFRLGAIIHTLRHEDGYSIKTDLAKGDAKYAIYSLETTKPTLVQEIGIANLAKTIVSGTDEIHEAEEEETLNMFDEPTEEELIERHNDAMAGIAETDEVMFQNTGVPTNKEMEDAYEAHMRSDRTSMERAADAEDPKLDKKLIVKEYDLIREVESALGFKPWEEKK